MSEWDGTEARGETKRHLPFNKDTTRSLGHDEKEEGGRVYTAKEREEVGKARGVGKEEIKRGTDREGRKPGSLKSAQWGGLIDFILRVQQQQQ